VSIEKSNFVVVFVSAVESLVEGAVRHLADAPSAVHFTDRVADEFREVILKVSEHFRGILRFYERFSDPSNNYCFVVSLVYTVVIKHTYKISIEKCNFVVIFMQTVEPFVEGAVGHLADAPSGVHFTDRVADEFREVIIKVSEHLRRILRFYRAFSDPSNNYCFAMTRMYTVQTRARVLTDHELLRQNSKLPNVLFLSLSFVGVLAASRFGRHLHPGALAFAGHRMVCLSSVVHHQSKVSQLSFTTT